MALDKAMPSVAEKEEKPAQAGAADFAAEVLRKLARKTTEASGGPSPDAKNEEEHKKALASMRQSLGLGGGSGGDEAQRRSAERKQEFFNKKYSSAPGAPG